MIIKNYKVFKGQHCETTALGNLLLNAGVELSEPMLFGLGSGLGCIFWNMKMMDFPFIGGRIKPDQITENVCDLLEIKLIKHETSSVKTAWQVVKEKVDSSISVGLKLDSYYLDYFTNKIHFAGHYTAIYGYDDTQAYLIDTAQQGSAVRTSLESLELSRNAKGPMSSRNLSFSVEKTHSLPDLKKIIPIAIVKNARDFLNPPIKNIGYKGIEKTSKEIFRWFETSKNIENDFALQALLMEKAGTGGALFRKIYSDFLLESHTILKKESIKIAFNLYTEAAQMWRQISEMFKLTGESKSVDYLKKASNLLQQVADKEQKAMEILEKL